MRMVVETTVCDACLAWKGVELAEGVEVVPVVPGRTLALCEEHREGLARVLALIGEFSEETSPTRKRKGERKREAVAAPRAASTNGHAVALVGGPVLVDRGGKRRGGARARARRERNPSPVVGRVEETVEDRRACPLCAHTSPTTAALGMHLRQKHAATLTDVYGRECPLCGVEAHTTGALGVHATTFHGLPRGGGVVDLFAKARAEGDPLGVIATRAAAIVEAASAPETALPV